MRLDDQFTWGRRCYLMAVMNATPDSFSGDGLLAGTDGAASVLERAGDFIAAGADILDIGGESTRPGAAPVGADEEAARVVPAIAAIRERFPEIAISVDTTKASVAEAALDAGADMVNDVTALKADSAMAPLVAKRGAPVILMHNASRRDAVEHDARLGAQYHAGQFDDVVEGAVEGVVEAVAHGLSERAQAAQAAGIDAGQIILDPGLGFGKTVAQNLALIDRLERIKALGYPVLLGPSRKSFIGRVLDLPVDERLEGTAACVAVGICRGADIVRVHDVAFMARVARMTEAIIQAGRAGGG